MNKLPAKDGEITLDADWQVEYKSQMEIYQWLFRKNGFKVSNTGYFVYCNGNTDKEAFDGRLEFDVKTIHYEGAASWTEATILEAIGRLKSDELPNSGSDCNFCKYRRAVKDVVSQFKKNETRLFKGNKPMSSKVRDASKFGLLGKPHLD